MASLELSLVRGATADDTRAQLLWHAASAVDLSDPRYSEDVAVIASWVHTGNAHLRQAVVATLCCQHHVRTAKEIALAGWERAEWPYVEWFVPALKRCVAGTEDLDSDSFVRIVGSALRHLSSRPVYTAEDRIREEVRLADVRFEVDALFEHLSTISMSCDHPRLKPDEVECVLRLLATVSAR